MEATASMEALTEVADEAFVVAGVAVVAAAQR